MPDSKHESQDLEDYEVDSANDNLVQEQGEDPVDRGVVPPSRWTAGMRYALKGEEDSESMDELLSEQEPDVLDQVNAASGEEDDADEEAAGGWDENETSADVTRQERDDDPDPRAGRLVAPSEDTDDIGGTLLDSEPELYARDTGISGGGASAEEAAVHVEQDPAEDTDDDDYEP
jgi:hypothetical protein